MADLIYMAKSKWRELLDTIRTKGGTSAPMTADQAIAAVEAIPSGGGGIEKAEGDFTIVSESGDNAPTLTHNLGDSENRRFDLSKIKNHSKRRIPQLLCGSHQCKRALRWSNMGI